MRWSCSTLSTNSKNVCNISVVPKRNTANSFHSVAKILWIFWSKRSSTNNLVKVIRLHYLTIQHFTLQQSTVWYSTLYYNKAANNITHFSKYLDTWNKEPAGWICSKLGQNTRLNIYKFMEIIGWKVLFINSSRLFCQVMILI